MLSQDIFGSKTKRCYFHEYHSFYILQSYFLWKEFSMAVREEQGNLKQTVYITSDRKRFRDRRDGPKKYSSLALRKITGHITARQKNSLTQCFSCWCIKKVSTTGKSRNAHQWNPIAVLRQKDGIGLRQKKCSYATKAYEQRSDQKDLRMAGKLPCFRLNLPYKGRISVVIQEPSCHTEQIRLFLFCKKIQGFFDLL